MFPLTPPRWPFIGQNTLVRNPRSAVYGAASGGGAGPPQTNLSIIEPDRGTVGGLHGVLINYPDPSTARVADVPSGHTGKSLQLSAGSEQFLALVGRLPTRPANCTLTAWFKRTTASYSSAIFGTPGGGTQYAGLFYTGNGAVYVGASEAVDQEFWEYNPDTDWHHIAIVTTGTTEVEVFIDGDSIGAADTLDNGLTVIDMIGRGGPGYFWEGNLFDLRVYFSSLTESQIEAVMGGGGPDAAHRWTFGDVEASQVAPFTSDSFNRSNSVGDIGSTDTAYGGTSIEWEVTNNSENYEISSNELNLDANPIATFGQALVECDTPNVVMQFTVASGASDARFGMGVVRSDGVGVPGTGNIGHCWIAYSQSYGMYIEEGNETTGTTSRVNTFDAAMLTYDSPVVVTIIANDSYVRFLQGKFTIFYGTATAWSEQTKHGIGLYGVNFPLDNFRLWRIGDIA